MSGGSELQLLPPFPKMLVALLVAVSEGALDFDMPSGLYINWTSLHPDDGTIINAGKADFYPAWAGTNAPDEHGTGGMTRRVVLGFDHDSCEERCQEPFLSSQQCVTGDERGQIAGVPLNSSILLYVAKKECGGGVSGRPYTNDFNERAGAAGMLYMWEPADYAGRPFLCNYNTNSPGVEDIPAPKKTVDYWEKTGRRGPKPKMIVTASMPTASLFHTDPHGDYGGLPMVHEIEKGLVVFAFWPGSPEQLSFKL